MKTLRNKKTGELKRLNDKEAEKLCRKTNLGWEYCSKTEWKKEHPSKVKEKTDQTSQTSNLSDKKIRKQRKEEKRNRHEQNRG